jgi:hypothetical protein
MRRSELVDLSGDAFLADGGMQQAPRRPGPSLTCRAALPAVPHLRPRATQGRTQRPTHPITAHGRPWSATHGPLAAGFTQRGGQSRSDLRSPSRRAGRPRPETTGYQSVPEVLIHATGHGPLQLAEPLVPTNVPTGLAVPGE